MGSGISWPEKNMNLLSTFRGSMMEGFLPAGWDLEKIDRLADVAGADLVRPRSWWHPQFEPVPCSTVADFDTFMGHEIAREIQTTRQEGRPLAIILPVGPMGMYRWTVYFLREWGVACDHVHGFNMDEWSDAQGNTLPPDNPGAFQYAMEHALYGPLGKLTIPAKQRHFALKAELPTYAAQIGDLKKQGAKLVTGWEDIVEELPTSVRAELMPVETASAEERTTLIVSVLGPAERSLYDLLNVDESLHVDELVERSGLTSSEVLAALFDLELKTVVRQLPGKQFLKVLL